MEQVLELQSDETPTSYSWATLSNNISFLSNGAASITLLTLCCRVLIPFYRNYHTVYSISLNENAYFLSLALVEDGVIAVLNETPIFFAPVVVPGYWHSLCLLLDLQKPDAFLYVNHDVYSANIMGSQEITDISTKSTAYMIFGQQQNTFGNYSRDTSYHGQISGFNLWIRLLTPEEVISYAMCEDSSINDAYVSWKQEAGKLFLNHTAEVVEIENKTICRPGGIYRALLSPPLFLPVAESICNLLGGNLIVEGVFENEVATHGELMALLDDDELDSVRLLSEGRKLSSNEHSHAKQKWKEASHFIKKECSSCTKKNSGYVNNILYNNHRRKIRQTDEDESEEPDEPIGEELSYTAVCEFTEPPVFRVLGYCEDLNGVLEERYVVLSHKGKLPIFQGYTGRSITYTRGKWVAKGPYESYIELWFQEPLKYPTLSPMGRNLWMILVTVDSDTSNPNDVTLPCDSEMIFLTLSPCPYGNFTCSDGQCFPLEVRCDRKADCEDDSDEKMCYKVFVPLDEFYLQLEPPRFHKNDLNEVFLKLSIQEAEIDINIMKITSEIQLTWKDPSLTFYNLQRDTLANNVDVDSLLNMWTPTVEFGGLSKTKILFKNDTELFVIKETNGILENYEFSWETTTYNGSENSVQFKENIKLLGNCSQKLFLYPFGQQICFVTFSLTASIAKVLNLSTAGDYGGVLWELKDNLNYDITDFQFVQKDEEMYSTQQLEIRMYPSLNLDIILLFLPSLFMLIIAYSSLYFNSDQAVLRCGISLGAFLAITFLHMGSGATATQKMGPKASDIWIFGCYAIVFLIIISHSMVYRANYNTKRIFSSGRVIPISMANGKAQSDPLLSPRRDENGESLANIMKFIFTITILGFIISYIVVFVILVSQYKE